MPVTLFGAKETTHNKINADLGRPDDPATTAFRLEGRWPFFGCVRRRTQATPGRGRLAPPGLQWQQLRDHPGATPELDRPWRLVTIPAVRSPWATWHQPRGNVPSARYCAKLSSSATASSSSIRACA